jgi:hypothetical protein
VVPLRARSCTPLGRSGNAVGWETRHEGSNPSRSAPRLSDKAIRATTLEIVCPGFRGVGLLDCHAAAKSDSFDFGDVPLYNGVSSGNAILVRCPSPVASKYPAGEGCEASWDSWRLLFLEKMEPVQTTNNPRNAGTRRSFGSGPSGWCSKPTSRAVSAAA